MAAAMMSSMRAAAIAPRTAMSGMAKIPKGSGSSLYIL